MRISTLAITLCCAMLCSYRQASAQMITSANTQGFELVELFTSEGCSSCPKADRVVAELQDKYRDRNMLVLGYHVDYWDYLGWKDVFSSGMNTLRQQYYTQILHLSSTYTPQAVVNGQYEMIGSDKEKIIAALSRPSAVSPVTVQIDNISIKGKQLMIQTNLGNVSKGDVLIYCLVQRKAETKVKNGENGGHTLQHINIVRKFGQIPAENGTNKLSLELSEQINKDAFFVAAFIQERSTGKIKIIATKAF